jgi:hypothetical protein
VQQSGLGSNLTAIHGAVSSFRLLTNYAGIANSPFFDLASFDLVGERSTVRTGRAGANPGTATASCSPADFHRDAFHSYDVHRADIGPEQPR